ncbi:tyrosine-protein phosphatase non-receptor type substrate 1-like isoform X2 [Anas acuta]
MELLPRRPAWPLTCLVLLSLRPWPGADAQAGFQLHQPQKEVSVRVGETLTLICTATAGGSVGPVKWLKGWGSGSETIFDQKDPSSSRGTIAVNESNTNFTILISDVRPEDAGTYYCVKFRKGPTGNDELYRRGNGTVVFVQARPSNPTVSGPSDRVESGKMASFTCKSGGFFPSNISVKWFKDKTSIQSQLPNVTPGPSNFTYNMSSTVTVTLQKDDIRSELTCQVLHTTLTAPLTRSYHLSQILRVPPKVVMEPPGPVGLNETVSFTCDVQGFYPGSVTVTWLENGKEMNTGSSPRPTKTPEGLFNLRSTVAVEAVLEKNGSVFTCRVVHEGQDPLSSSATLWVAASGQKESNSPYTNGSSLFIYVAVGVVCTVLALLVVAILYLIRVKQSKGKSSPSARLHEPEKSSGTTTQDSDPNNMTYADLNFTKEKKNVQRVIEVSQQSEYACIQGSQAPASNDNLTYADLDMVHLSKAPRRPAPCPEETTSEYASVQIQRQ